MVSAVVCSWHRWCSLADALVSKHPATSLVHHPDANFLNSSSIFATFVMSWIGYDKLVNQTCHNDEVKIFDFRIHTSSFFNNFHFISPLFVSCHRWSPGSFDHKLVASPNLPPFHSHTLRGNTTVQFFLALDGDQKFCQHCHLSRFIGPTPCGTIYFLNVSRY